MGWRWCSVCRVSVSIPHDSKTQIVLRKFSIISTRLPSAEDVEMNHLTLRSSRTWSKHMGKCLDFHTCYVMMSQTGALNKLLIVVICVIKYSLYCVALFHTRYLFFQTTFSTSTCFPDENKGTVFTYNLQTQSMACWALFLFLLHIIM